MAPNRRFESSTRNSSNRTRDPKPFVRLVESNFIRRVSSEKYRQKISRVYGGRRGALLATASFLSLHSPLSERWLKKGKFDLGGAREILDVGSGAGQIALHLLKHADAAAKITCCDLSRAMLKRARQRMQVRRHALLNHRRYDRLPSVDHAVADISRLPFPDASFDCITCGYVLEHLPEARIGLAELARVLRPGGRMLLLTTEDNFGGAWTSRVWRCRTYNRSDLRRVSQQLGLRWQRELWFSPLHKRMRAGGICVSIEKQPG